MRIDILTLFPEMFIGPFDASMIKRARDNNFVDINIHNLRDWATDKHKTVDERPYGGGKGMVIKVDVMDKAISNLQFSMTKQLSKSQFPNSKIKSFKKASQMGKQKLKVILLSPQGKVFDQEKARQLAKCERLILIAGHYEGFDERIREHLVDEEISIGDYVLTGGELSAMVIVDSVVRLLPGVLDDEATITESFSLPKDAGSRRNALLDFPQYTRPETYKRWKVPEILLTGNHKEIDKWRREQALTATRKKRPDLLSTTSKDSPAEV